MGPWVTAMSARRVKMSAWLLMGLPVAILAFGFGQIWIGIGLAIGTIANWIIVARPRFAQTHRPPQYLSNRFAHEDLTLQIHLRILVILLHRSMSPPHSSRRDVFTMVFPSLSPQMLLFALIIIIYTFLGG